MRISKVTTRQGDSGNTTLAQGERLSKDDPLIHLIGEVDELNSFVGMLLCQMKAEKTELIAEAENLLAIQQKLFDLGAEFSLPGHNAIDEQDLLELESMVEKINATLPPLKEFVLPGSDTLNAWAHICRTVCRRVERNYVFCQKQSLVSNPCTLKWLNRLSDYFFILSRCFSISAQESEIMWQNKG